MKKILGIGLAFGLLLLAAKSDAQMWTGIFVGAGSGTAVTPAVACSNKLDFSAACNSQYIPVIL